MMPLRVFLNKDNELEQLGISQSKKDDDSLSVSFISESDDENQRSGLSSQKLSRKNSKLSRKQSRVHEGEGKSPDSSANDIL